MSYAIQPPERCLPKEHVVDQTDSGLGYAAFAALCRENFQREPGATCDLTRQGFNRFELLSSAQADKILALLKKAESDSNLFDDLGGGIGAIKIHRPEVMRMILMTLITPMVDQQLTALFGAEYRIKWFSCQRVVYDQDANISFLWHKDMGPSEHAKMIVYLSDTSETGGRTDFIDAETTEQLRQAGYDFVDLQERFEDLRPFAEERDIPLTVYDAPYVKGEAVLFHPVDVLHRGVKPHLAPRYTITLCLVPHDEPWTAWLDNYSPDEIQSEKAVLWDVHRPWEN